MTTTCSVVKGGCSAESEVVDIGPDGYLVYASGSSVILTHLTNNNNENDQILPSPMAGQVHSVRIIHQNGKSKNVVAVTSGGHFRIWSLNPTICLVEDLKHSNALNSLAVHMDSDDVFTCIYSDITGKVYLFSHDQREPLIITSFILKKVISLGLICMDGIPIILVGLSDNTLTIIVEGKVVSTLAGHGNWINSIDCLSSYGNSFLIATGASDKTVRIWRLKEASKIVNKDILQELVPSVKEFTLPTGQKLSVECESMMYAHESMVHSVRWERFGQNNNMRLLSAAADHTLIIWERRNGMWTSVSQVGDISNIGSVGGDRSFGFYSGILCTNKYQEWIVAHGSTGSVIPFTLSNGVGFKAEPPLTSGHVGFIEDCSWSPDGQFLMTVGRDKTTRTWSQTTLNNRKWVEVARPQIHGYEMRTISVLDTEHFLSAGDEKILRSFKAPRSFTARMAAFRGESINPELLVEEAIIVPALGLSNKALDTPSNLTSGPISTKLDTPPSEHELSRLSLWMETDKLYAHGMEIYTLAVSPLSHYAATASKASTIHDAVIKTWKRNKVTDTWTLLPSEIKAHSLTVVKMAFSPNEEHLLAVSRDRSFTLTKTDGWELQIVKESAHTRIIWACTWSFDSSFFVTGSRDGSIKTWNLVGENIYNILAMDSAVTCLAMHAEENLLAVGLENGKVFLYQLTKDSEWILYCNLHNAPTSVNSMQWRPKSRELAVVSTLLQIHQVSQK